MPASRSSAVLVCLLLASGAYAAPSRTEDTLQLLPHERLVTILSTNDIHGGVEPSAAELEDQSKATIGGMAYWVGTLRSIREGLANQYGKKAGSLLVDAGDQFQGTLISNYNEGSLVFSLMSLAGYDAVVPGNHDYDFGPAGWLNDQVTPENPDQNPRGVIEKLARSVKFPLLSSNTYYKNSIQDVGGASVEASGIGCEPATAPSGVPAVSIDWGKAKRPAFLTPHLIREVADVRVALIGIDHKYTPEMTTVQNVSDLCFRDEADAFLDQRASLEGQADLFVLVIHGGDFETDSPTKRIVERILAKGGSLDLVVGGHTHMVEKKEVGGVPMVQSGTAGEKYGRVDLVWDTKGGKPVPEKRRVLAGVKLLHDRCDAQASGYCSEVVIQLLGGKVRKAVVEGKLVSEDKQALALVAKSREEVNPLAKRKMGESDGELWRSRINESPLSNAITDAFLRLSGADVALVNTGGLRAGLPSGTVDYEAFFRVLPFGNHGVMTTPMPATTLVALLQRAARTCGSYGSLMQSGLKVTIERACAAGSGGVNEKAKLVRVETLAGEVIVDAAAAIEPSPLRVFNVATFDFLMAGGSGYQEFTTLGTALDFGILREAMTEEFLKHPAAFSSKTDGRWTVVKPIEP